MTRLEKIKNAPRLEDNRIDWKALVPKEHLYVNNQHKDKLEKQFGKTLAEIPIEEIENKYLVMKLSGSNFLLNLIGYYSVNTHIDTASPDFVSATCHIVFAENEDGISQTYSASASAHPGNVNSWYRNYLSEAASNRAKVRCLRFYTNLDIVSSEELGSNQVEPEEPSHAAENPLSENLRNKIIRLMDEKEIKFSTLKAKCKLPDTAENVCDIEVDRLVEIHDRCAKYVKPEKK